jgi:hypothetical protein
MQSLTLLLGSLIVISVSAVSSLAHADPSTTMTSYAVMRNGQQIGTSTVQLRRDGPQTIAEVTTHIQVKIAYITVYRYTQTETEHWTDGRLTAMNSVTDDNGTAHKVNARRRGDKLAVEADGKISEVDPSMMPASLWNPSLVQRTMALSTQDGSVMPVSVVDRGKEDVVLRGRPTLAHHYSIATTFPQEVWYDENRQLIRVELRGSDGSKIHYQPS